MTTLDGRTRAWLIMQLKPDRVSQAETLTAAVETGAVCNLRCPFCRTGNGSMELDQELLSLESFRDFLDRLGSQLKFMTLLRWGEPLLNPDICEMTRLAASRGVATLIHTNLSLPSFDDDAAERLVASGLTELTISCDGASQAVYQRYRVGGRFRLVLRNIKRLLAAKARLRSASPKLRWQFLVHKGNEHECGKARELAGRLGVTLEFRPLWAPDDWKPQTPPPVFEYQPCLQAWDMPGIHSDGTVLPCCVVTDRRFSLGNVLEEKLEDIWNKPLAVAMRRYLRSGVDSGIPLPCHGCPRDPNAAQRP